MRTVDGAVESLRRRRALHARDELSRLKGLGDVVVRAGLEAEHNVYGV